MKPLCLILTLLAVPIGAQSPTPTPSSAPTPAGQTAIPSVVAHPVRIILQVDPPPSGVLAIDSKRVAEALNAFSKDHGLVPPTGNGDGWVLGIHIRTQKVRENLFAAVCTLRLSQIKAGQVQKEGSKESDALLMTMEPGGFDDGLGHELVRQAWYLLSTKQAIPDVPPMPEKALDPSPSMPWETIDAINFSKVQIVFQPRQGIYPPDAKLNRVQGTVAMELTVKEDGSPESATVIEGPGPLLVYSMEYALRWRFAPLLVDGTAVKFRFRLVMNFRLN